jgi:hypothetical protein
MQLFIFSSIIALATSLVIEGTNEDSELIFNPTDLKMDNAIETFTVRMKNPPSVRMDAVVHLTYPGNLNFDKCTLHFTHLNYNLTQTVTIRSTPSFGQDSEESVAIKASLCAPDTDINESGVLAAFSVVPTFSPGGICSSTGYAFNFLY